MCPLSLELSLWAGVAGLYDYGPPGSALQANIVAEWRRHFIVEEHMLELDTTIMTPATVFETSGHVARFADWMVKDTKTGDVLRADHLVKGVLEARLAGDREARGQSAEAPKEEDKKRKKKIKTTAVKLEDDIAKEYDSILAQVSHILTYHTLSRTPSVRYPNYRSLLLTLLESDKLNFLLTETFSHQLDNYSGPELGELCRKYKITNPDTGNEVGEPQQFNLMFASSIGPTGQHPGCVLCCLI